MWPASDPLRQWAAAHDPMAAGPHAQHQTHAAGDSDPDAEDEADVEYDEGSQPEEEMAEDEGDGDYEGDSDEGDGDEGDGDYEGEEDVEDEDEDDDDDNGGDDESMADKGDEGDEDDEGYEGDEFEEGEVSEAFEPMSTSESDEDEEHEPSHDWMQVGLSFSEINALIDAINKQKHSSRFPEGEPSPTHPEPEKKSCFGQYKYVQYVPEWTHPAWDDAHIPLDAAFRRVQRKLYANDLGRRLRPALLPQDSVRNPTPMAQRYGIFPDRTDGRSKLSPTDAPSRRVGLPQPLRTPDGTWRHSLTWHDLPAPLRALADDHHRDGRGPPSSLPPFLAASGAAPGDHEPLMAAFQALYELVEEDRDFQRIVFQGLTTDEKIKFGVHTTEELDFVGYDLGLPLHDLVARKRWVTPISRGFAPDEPRYLYNLFGRRGEYCADDEFLWAALQPALQLVSHVLSINHPFWLAALDVMSRVPVDPSRNRYGAVGDPMVAIWRDLAQPTLPNERAFFQSIGFDARRAAAHFLQERLVLDIACSFRDPFSKAPSSHWGMTGYEHYEDPRRRTVAVHISADMLWPLLVPTFTQAEKASVSLMVASTLLHELSHATNFAINALVNNPCADARYISAIQDLGPLALQTLQTVGRILQPENSIEPFWENEPREELGFAFENQIWGGVLDVNIEAHYRDKSSLSFLALDVNLDNWPSSLPNPHTTTDQRVLVDPPLPIDQTTTPLSVRTWARLFRRHFWRHDLPRYGHQALRLVPETSMPVLIRPRYARLRDFKRVFGPAEGHWLKLALDKVALAGKATLAQYLRELVDDRLGHIWVRKRWHHDARQWDYRDGRLADLLGDARRRAQALAALLQSIGGDAGAKQANLDALNQQLLHTGLLGGQPVGMATYDAVLRGGARMSLHALLTSLVSLHQHLLRELEVVQCLVLDYLKQPPAARRVLYDRYARRLGQRIEGHFVLALDERAQALAVTRDLFRAPHHAGLLDAAAEAEIHRVGGMLQADRRHFVDTKVFVEMDYLDRLDGWQGKFATVPTGSYRRRSQILERFAAREKARCEEPVRRIVDMIGTILEQHSLQFDNDDAGADVDNRMAARMEEGLRPTSPRKTRAGSKAGQLGQPQPDKQQPETAPPAGASSAEAAPLIFPHLIRHGDSQAWLASPIPQWPLPARAPVLAGPDAAASPGAASAPPPPPRQAPQNITFGVSGFPPPSATSTPAPPGFVSFQDPLTGFTQYASTASPFVSTPAPDDPHGSNAPQTLPPPPTSDAGLSDPLHEAAAHLHIGGGGASSTSRSVSPAPWAASSSLTPDLAMSGSSPASDTGSGSSAFGPGGPTSAPAGVAWQPFGTPYSITTTLSEDVDVSDKQEAKLKEFLFGGKNA